MWVNGEWVVVWIELFWFFVGDVCWFDYWFDLLGDYVVEFLIEFDCFELDNVYCEIVMICFSVCVLFVGGFFIDMREFVFVF